MGYDYRPEVLCIGPSYKFLGLQIVFSDLNAIQSSRSYSVQLESTLIPKAFWNFVLEE